MVGGFRDLKIWQKGYELVLDVRKLTNKYPKDERFGLTDQTNRSSVSVISLIAEACGRYFYKDKMRILFESRGEIEETRSHLSVAFGLHYISENEFKRLDLEYEFLSRSLNSYIKSLNINANKPIN